jgi:hypothetical protein
MDAKSLKAAFHEAVDDYLELCAAEGRRPDIPLKGSFNIRPGRELHRRAMLYAKRRGMDLNTVVSDALRRYLEREDRVARRRHHQEAFKPLTTFRRSTGSFDIVFGHAYLMNARTRSSLGSPCRGERASPS